MSPTRALPISLSRNVIPHLRQQRRPRLAGNGAGEQSRRLVHDQQVGVFEDHIQRRPGPARRRLRLSAVPGRSSTSTLSSAETGWLYRSRTLPVHPHPPVGDHPPKAFAAWRSDNAG
jgi:hypothetical protein